MSSSMGRMTTHIWNGKWKMVETTKQLYNMVCPLVLSHSYWKLPLIVDLPILNGDCPVRKLLDYQRAIQNPHVSQLLVINSHYVPTIWWLCDAKIHMFLGQYTCLLGHFLPALPPNSAFTVDPLRQQPCAGLQNLHQPWEVLNMPLLFYRLLPESIVIGLL